MDELVRLATRLEELGRHIVRAYIEWDPDEVARLANEFSETKRNIQAYLIEHPSAQLPGEKAASARAVLNKIAAGETLPVEDALVGKLIDCDLDEDELEEIGMRELYSWISHIEYAAGLFKAGALVSGAGKLPGNLEVFLGEARQCFAFQQYNAVCALCRTMLDITIKDIATVCRILDQDDGNVAQMARRKHEALNDLINAVTHRPEFSHLREPLHAIRISTNPVVHGGRTADQTVAIQILRDTLSIIHRLHEAIRAVGASIQ